MVEIKCSKCWWIQKQNHFSFKPTIKCTTAFRSAKTASQRFLLQCLLTNDHKYFPQFIWKKKRERVQTCVITSPVVWNGQVSFVLAMSIQQKQLLPLKRQLMTILQVQHRVNFSFYCTNLNPVHSTVSNSLSSL